MENENDSGVDSFLLYFLNGVCNSRNKEDNSLQFLAPFFQQVLIAKVSEKNNFYLTSFKDAQS